MSERTCDITGCDKPATHRAEIVIYAASAKPHQPAIGTMGIRVCAAHATDENARELLTEPGKRQIERGFTGIGRAKPDWSRSFARWAPITKVA